jgi:hypothetical protein
MEDVSWLRPRSRQLRSAETRRPASWIEPGRFEYGFAFNSMNGSLIHIDLWLGAELHQVEIPRLEMMLAAVMARTRRQYWNVAEFDAAVCRRRDAYATLTTHDVRTNA